MHFSCVALIGLIVAGWFYWLAAARRVDVVLRRRRDRDDAFTPGVSILKPLKGLDSDLYRNLESFCRQAYPRFELIVGTRDADDPALEAVRKLRRKFPRLSIRAFVAPDLGLNPKSAILHELVRHASHDLLVISDSDIRVGRHYLRRVTAPLRDPAVGLVTCLYRSNCCNTIAAMLGSLHIDLAFLPSAALGSCLPRIRCAFGATMALRRNELLAAGGYAAIADHLADDFHIAAKVLAGDLKFCLADFLVTHVVGDDSLAAMWTRRVRWARTIRAAAPLQYFGMLVTFSTPWSIVLLILSGLSGWAWGIVAASLLLRWATAWRIAGAARVRTLRRHLAWLPASDCIDALIWTAGLFGRHVTWRGTTYRLLPDGRLADESAPALIADAHPNVGRRLIGRLDAHLRERSGIFEYSSDPDCLFRIQIRTAEEDLVLADGAAIERGQRVLELHLWNEHIPRMRPGAMMAWSQSAGGRVVKSLALLRSYLAARDDLRDIQAIYARASFAARNERQLRRLVERFGFECRGAVIPSGAGASLHRAGENLLVWALIWAFNPAADRKTLFGRPRYEVWMSRQALRSRYGRKRPAAVRPGMLHRRSWASAATTPVAQAPFRNDIR